jgi:hypothetical protein
MDEVYLGDSVYADYDGFHIWIWTSDGVSKSCCIALEPQVLDALNNYRARLLERVRTSRGAPSQ